MSRCGMKKHSNKTTEAGSEARCCQSEKRSEKKVLNESRDKRNKKKRERREKERCGRNPKTVHLALDENWAAWTAMPCLGT